MKEVSTNLWLIAFVIFIGILVTGSLLIATLHMGFGFFWIILIVLAIYFLATEKKGPKEILEERYARGEISRKHYMQIKKDLR